MVEWTTLTIEQVCRHIQSGGTPNTKNSDFYKGEIPFVMIEDITASRKYLIETVKKISEEGLKNSSSWIVPVNSVLYSIYATLGIPVISRVPVATNQAILNLIPNINLITTEYLYYYLIFIRNEVFKFTGQTTQSNLSSSIVRKLQLKLPASLTEQTRIAQILSKADEAIAHTEALIAKYQRIKTGLMQDLLTRGIDENGNIRSEETHAFKDSPLGRIPVEWEVSTIGDSCRVQNQFRKPISSEVREKMKGIYPYYGPTGIQDLINECRVKGKYVLIGEDGDHFLKWKKQEMTILVEGEFNVNNHAHILEGTEECLTEWINAFFSHRDITLFLTRQGAGRYKLNKAALQKLEILLPPIEEQKRIIEKIASIKDQIDACKTNLIKLQSLKRGLMQDLLSGPREAVEKA